MTHPLPPGRDRQHLWQWSVLAVSSLAIAGVFAVLLILSKAPVTNEIVPWPEDFFQKGLIVHVALAFLVWILSVFGALNVSVAANIGKLYQQDKGQDFSGIAIFLSAVGTLAMLLPAFRNESEPNLSNYVPVIIDPTYYWGLGLLGLGILVSVLCIFLKLENIRNILAHELPIIIAAGLLYLIAIFSVLFAVILLKDQPVDYDFNESLFWATGHILQVLNVSLFFIASSLLYRKAFKALLANKTFFNWIGGVLLLIGILNLSIFAIFEFGTTQYFFAFTQMQYALGVPTIAIMVTICHGLWRQRGKFLWQDPATISLTSALAVFSIGMLFGLSADGQDTRTPAHYHGIIGGMNLLFVGLFYCWFFPLLGRVLPSRKLILSQIVLYAVGQSLFVMGMFFTGSHGASRKIMGAGIEMDSPYVILATLVKDFGGGLAIIGGVLFVFIALKALFRHADIMQ